MSNVGVPLDEQYLEWLIGMTVHDGAPPLNDYVYRLLYKTPFEYIIANDYNRAWEGIALRFKYLGNPSYPYDRETQEWLELECSVLEMMVALSLRASYQSGDEAAWWFDIFSKNLGLGSSPSKAKNIIRVLNKRHYNSDGYGGMFPLNYPEADQREVEIWYQLAAYILENELY